MLFRSDIVWNEIGTATAERLTEKFAVSNAGEAGDILLGIIPENTKEKAIALGITGSVQNLHDGNVHIIATGTREQLDELTSWCRQGPRRAIVKNIITKDLPLQSFNDFSIDRSL